MEAYEIVFGHRASKGFQGLPPQVQKRLVPRIDALSIDPRPSGCEKLTGEKGAFRIRVGDYRIVYRVDDVTRTVSVDRIAHRKDVYRR
jgi:mRNA interferase RelE/StbE